MREIKSIRNGTIVTLDPNRRILKNSSIVINRDRIEWIGSEKNFPSQFNHVYNIDANNKVVYPGFINAHSHAALTIVRGIGDELGTAPAYTPNVPQGEYLSPDDCFVLSLLGGLESLKFGTTCIVDNYIHEDAATRAFAKLGLRAVVSEFIRDVNARKIPQRIYEFDLNKGTKTLQKNLDLIDKWHLAENGRITCRLGPHTPDGCSSDLLTLVREHAEKLDVGMVIHLAQSKGEVEELSRRENMTPTEYLHNLGILGPNLIAGHCIYVTEKDMELIGSSGTHVVHLSGSNAKGGMMAPIKALKQRGANITIGSDNMAYDMIEVMRLALCTARMLDEDPIAFKAIDMLEMATINAAKALGMEKEIGSIEIGKKADIILIDYKKPHLVPIIDHIANLVHNALGSDVTTVLIDGEIIMENNDVCSVDEEQVLNDGQSVTESCWERISSN
jgi:5-methylthioadenosine/S-adenosylhomocysteine deaminase